MAAHAVDIPWDRVPPDMVDPILSILSEPTRLAAPRRRWPSEADGLVPLSRLIHKAGNARRGPFRDVHPRDADPQYRAQEKLNGVFVLWDGAALWTKAGHRIQLPDAFLRALPPAFPFVGELYLGNGRHRFSFAVSLSQNKLLGAATLPVGVRPQ